MRDRMYISFAYTYYTRLYGDRTRSVCRGRAVALASHASLKSTVPHYY
jgi:hypothetical protein